MSFLENVLGKSKELLENVQANLNQDRVVAGGLALQMTRLLAEGEVAVDIIECNCKR